MAAATVTPAIATGRSVENAPAAPATTTIARVSVVGVMMATIWLIQLAANDGGSPSERPLFRFTKSLGSTVSRFGAIAGVRYRLCRGLFETADRACRQPHEGLLGEQQRVVRDRREEPDEHEHDTGGESDPATDRYEGVVRTQRPPPSVATKWIIETAINCWSLPASCQ